MNRRKQIKNVILRRFFGKMLRAAVICMTALIACLFLGKTILGSYTWYGDEGLYPFFHWISDNQGIFIVFLFLAGLVAIGIFYWIKLLDYFQEVLDAMEQLNHTENLIQLRPGLQEVEQYMNGLQRQREQSERRAKEAEQRKSDLVVYLAHDLKTPLTSVIGYLSLLKEERDISPELQEKYLSVAFGKALRLEDLINEFFEITRFNLTHLELELSTISLKMLLEQTVFEFQPIFAEKNLSCKLELEPEDMKIACDPEKLQRVFDNLLRNAALYSYEGSTIHIRAKLGSHSGGIYGSGSSKAEIPSGQVLRQEGCIHGSGSSKAQILAKPASNIAIIQVENAGATIPEEKLGRIFEQFYRLDSARQSKNGGAGLGLAIAKEIVRLHGGAIRAESRQERTVFTVELPLQEARQEIAMA